MSKNFGIFTNVGADLQHFGSEKSAEMGNTDILTDRVNNHGQQERLPFFPQSKAERTLALDSLITRLHYYGGNPIYQTEVYENAQSFHKSARIDATFLGFEIGDSDLTLESMARYVIFKSVDKGDRLSWPTKEILKQLVNVEVLKLKKTDDDAESLLKDARLNASSRFSFWGRELADVDYLPSVKYIKDQQHQQSREPKR